MSPKSLHTAVQSLTNEQKDVLKKIGFESILNIKLDIIPSKIAFFVVDKYNFQQNRLITKYGTLEITPRSVNEILGVPIGGKDILTLPEYPEEHPIVDQWKKQYGTNICPSEIAAKITSSNDSGLIFILNFIILFVNTICMCYSNGYCIVKLLNQLVQDVDVLKLDWCKYIVDCLIQSKMNWGGGDKYYSGPITYLTVSIFIQISFVIIYLYDSHICPHDLQNKHHVQMMCI